MAALLPRCLLDACLSGRRRELVKAKLVAEKVFSRKFRTIQLVDVEEAATHCRGFSEHTSSAGWPEA